MPIISASNLKSFTTPLPQKARIGQEILPDSKTFLRNG